MKYPLVYLTLSILYDLFNDSLDHSHRLDPVFVLTSSS